ncbi:unnamed protein product [Boreogadus saida]
MASAVPPPASLHPRCYDINEPTQMVDLHRCPHVRDRTAQEGGHHRPSVDRRAPPAASEGYVRQHSHWQEERRTGSAGTGVLDRSGCTLYTFHDSRTTLTL